MNPPLVLRTRALAIPACAALLLAACGGSPDQYKSVEARAYAAPPPAPRDSMHMLDSTFQRLTDLFGSTFSVKGTDPLLNASQEIPYDSLVALVPGGSDMHGLFIEYGLSGDSLRLAFEIVPLDTTNDPTLFTFTPGKTVQDWNNNRFTSWTRTAWKSAFQSNPNGPGGYLKTMMVKRTTGGSFVPLDPETDTRALMFAWEQELVALHEQNDEHPDSTLSTVFCSMARPDENDSLRHSIVVHMRARPTASPSEPGRDLIDNSYEPEQLLQMHGADFGSQCPPNCSNYYLPPQ